MARIVAGMGSSHAFAFMDPDRWDERRQVTRSRFAKKYGAEPPEHPRLAEQPLDFSRTHYKTIRDGLDRLKANLAALRPDALIVIGDDQNENYREDNLPQFAIYTGAAITSVDRENGITRDFRCAHQLAADILEHCVEAGVDLASSAGFPENRLISHAHAQVISFLEPSMPVLPFFVNAINVPAATPARCYAVGQQLRAAIEASNAAERVVLYASGGLSHFTAGYPWSHYSGPCTLGSICDDFDRQLVDTMSAGRGSHLTELSSRDLIDNGEIEFRQWIVLLGALGDRRPEWLVYEPLFRGLIGMAVGYWPLESEPAVQALAS